jgi:hypothetical protein
MRSTKKLCIKGGLIFNEKSNAPQEGECMKKEEISEIMLHLWSNVDQAPMDGELQELMKAAPISAQKSFIEAMVEATNLHQEPDEEILNKAKRLVGFDE